MTATLLKHVAVKTKRKLNYKTTAATAVADFDELSQTRCTTVRQD